MFAKKNISIKETNTKTKDCTKKSIKDFPRYFMKPKVKFRFLHKELNVFRTEWDLNPRYLRTSVFKTETLNHSDIRPLSGSRI